MQRSKLKMVTAMGAIGPSRAILLQADGIGNNSCVPGENVVVAVRKGIIQSNYETDQIK